MRDDGGLPAVIDESPSRPASGYHGKPGFLLRESCPPQRRSVGAVEGSACFRMVSSTGLSSEVSECDGLGASRVCVASVLVGLLDVNVLVAVLDENHTHNAAAETWLAGNIHHGWASCPLDAERLRAHRSLRIRTR